MSKLTEDQRRAIMSCIKGRDTKPELAVRRLLHRLGYRFRLHRRDLPGTPDIVLPRRGKVILVNGCFWHRHDCSAGRKWPNRNVSYWKEKFRRNQKRDEEKIKALMEKGWDVCVVWECQVANVDVLANQLEAFLEHGFLSLCHEGKDNYVTYDTKKKYLERTSVLQHISYAYPVDFDRALPRFRFWKN